MTRSRFAVIAALAGTLALAVAASGQVLARTAGSWRSPRHQDARGTPSGPPTTARPLPRLKTKTGTCAVALTFDDGPTWAGTEQILEVLREAGVKATFCVLGKMARTYPERIRQIVRTGHTLCNHGDNHDVKLGTLERGGDPGKPPGGERRDPRRRVEREDLLLPPRGRRLDTRRDQGGRPPHASP
jgi:hypothetical protein